uniref:HTH CENPB-type domain-containing protein n=1 Tax=Sparus aurata TaxID=8175 RepID=A0A671XQP1_SPAAU
MAPAQKRKQKYDLKFKLSVVKYAEENSGEAAARHFCVDPKRVRDWRKNKKELQRLSEEDSKRARLPGGGRKKASEELESNMRNWVISKRARHERVARKMIRVMAKEMYATVSDGRGEEFAASVGWLNRFLSRNNFTSRRRTTIAHKDAKEFVEKLVTFVTFSSRMIETKKILDRDIIAMDETAVWFD